LVKQERGENTGRGLRGKEKYWGVPGVVHARMV
jgi:hypothetical protein